MKKALLLLGAIVLVSFFACGNGCILETTDITIVVTDFVCSEFPENHDSEEYMDEIVDVTQDFWEDLDGIMDDAGMTKDDILEFEILGIYYKVISGPTPPPPPDTEWTVSGRFWVNVDGVEELIAPIQSQVLTGPTDYIELIPEDDGLDLLTDALEQYLAADDPSGYPDVFFKSDREEGDIDPSPTEAWPFVMTWHGCLQMRIDFSDAFDVYDMFPGD